MKGVGLNLHGCSFRGLGGRLSCSGRRMAGVRVDIEICLLAVWRVRVETLYGNQTASS